MKVEVSDLRKMYSDFCAVNNVSFSFESGRIFSLIGRNGSGKTSTLRMMLGTLSRDGGSVLADGKPLTKQLNNVGYLSEERGLYVKDPILEQLIFFGMLKGMSRKQARKIAKGWLERLGIADRAYEKLETLSKGNQQKIQIIASLLHNPEIVIFDEPFSGLDPVNAKFLIDLVVELKEQNKCVLLSSHQLHLLENVCDDLAIISYSNLVYSGTVQELKREKGGKTILIKFEDTNENELKKITYLNKTQDGKYMVPLSENKGCQEVLQDLFLRKLKVESFEVKEKTLNDIFIEMEEGK